MDKKTKHIDKARSKFNGVVYSVNSHPEIGIEAGRDQDGNIYTTVVPAELTQRTDYCDIVLEQKNTLHIDKITLWLRIAVITIGILVLAKFDNTNVLVAMIWFSIFVAEDFVRFLTLSYQLKFGTQKPIARYHSAEHMTISAYERLQRIPTIEEVKKESRFCKTCGSRFTINNLAINLLVVIYMMLFASRLPFVVYVSIGIALIAIMEVICTKGGLRFFQILVTSKPTNEEIEVAIAGLREIDKINDSAKEPFMCVASFGGFGIVAIYTSLEEEEPNEEKEDV